MMISRTGVLRLGKAHRAKRQQAELSALAQLPPCIVRVRFGPRFIEDMARLSRRDQAAELRERCSRLHAEGRLGPLDSKPPVVETDSKSDCVDIFLRVQGQYIRRARFDLLERVPGVISVAVRM
ncbi:MAG TPA: hypothetical protein P5305_01475 [Rubrivivax sp.]|nr:hypothetical protein [Rubrivivax sp.]HRY86523.1 hypothetical protein [Rubrivivax sp.]